jgi:hypothetical protein
VQKSYFAPFRLTLFHAVCNLGLDEPEGIPG